MSSDLSKDLEGTRSTFRELSGGTIDSKVSIVKKDLLTNRELGSRTAMLVIESLHVCSSLGESLSGILLDLLEVRDEVFNGLNGSLDSREGANVRMVAIVRVEGSGLEGLVVTVVQRELNDRQPVNPIILMEGDNSAKSLLDFLIGSLGLSIRLGMIGCRESCLYLEVSIGFLRESGGVLGTTIRDDLVREAMELPNILQIEMIETFGVESGRGGSEMNHLASLICNSPDGVVALAGRETSDEIRSDDSPGSGSRIYRFEFSLGLATMNLGPLADIARRNGRQRA